MDSINGKLIAAIQDAVPLQPDCWDVLGGSLGISGTEVSGRIAGLRDEGIIREISGIFDLTRAGYRQSLVAFRLPEDRLHEGGNTVAGHPGVSHCYGRGGAYNLWFTLAVSSSSKLGLDGTVGRLAEISGAAGSMILPTIQRFKLAPRFNPEGPVAMSLNSAGKESGETLSLTEDDREIIRALQVDLPACADPFGVIVADRGVESVDVLLSAAKRYLDAGLMRRYAAVLHHRAAGAKANVMVVWDVPDAEMEIAGQAAAQDPAVSHCYSRPVFPDWPFGLYTMVHGRSDEEVAGAVERIASAAGITERSRRLELFTTKEFAKRRVKLFSPEESSWEASTS